MVFVDGVFWFVVLLFFLCVCVVFFVVFGFGGCFLGCLFFFSLGGGPSGGFVWFLGALVVCLGGT
ncbi:hypothetical protein, partial [Pseudomonas syringae group genomosp. 7]